MPSSVSASHSSAPPLSPEQAFQWGHDAMRHGDWLLAVQRWAVLRAAYPDQAAVWIQAAMAFNRLGEHSAADELAAEARRRFPRNANGWLQGARAAAGQARPERSRALLEEARRRFPGEAEVWWQSADWAMLQGEQSQAALWNQHLRRSFPEYLAGFIQQAEFAEQERQWSRARAVWETVRERFPHQPAGYRRAAALEDHLGETSRARHLRLAHRYGNTWLRSLEQRLVEPVGAIAPMQRRGVGTFVDLVWTKARLNLKSEANQNSLRYLWWLLDPLLYMGVFYLVFGVLLQRGGDDYVPYLLTGLVPFQWFAKTVQHSANTIVQGRGLMNLVRVSPLFFPLVAVVQNAGKQLPVFGLLAVLLVLCGVPPDLHWLALVPVIVVQLMLMIAVGCLTAMLVPFVRDLLNLVPTGIQFVLFCSGVFYSVETIPEQWRTLFFVNPMANLLYQYRCILVEHRWPDWSMTGWLALGCVVALALVWMIYRRLEGVFPRVVIE